MRRPQPKPSKQVDVCMYINNATFSVLTLLMCVGGKKNETSLLWKQEFEMKTNKQKPDLGAHVPVLRQRPLVAGTRGCLGHWLPAVLAQSLSLCLAACE